MHSSISKRVEEIILKKLGKFELDRIYLGDCRELMKQMPDNCIDLVLTDPPWFVSSEVIIHRSMNPKKYKYVGKDIHLDFGKWDHFTNEEEYWKFTKSWFKEATRVLKPKGHLITFFDRNRVTPLIEFGRSLGLLMRQHLYWLKSNPVPRARKVDFMVALEGAVWFTKDTKSGATFNYQLGQQRNYVEAPLPGSTIRRHPTQKPIKVLKVWISYLSNPNDIIFDPFCGSGSTLVAAKKLRRHFLGFDIDEKYVKISKEWLKQIEYPLEKYITKEEAT